MYVWSKTDEKYKHAFKRNQFCPKHNLQNKMAQLQTEAD